MRPDLDYRGFIRRNTRLMPVPLVPEISLYMADDATELWQHTEADFDAVGLPPPFWAFAWAGGQALARYLLDRPNGLRGARVLDFASGSGLVAIAASLAGAGTSTANDVDVLAGAAAALNAEANGVVIETCSSDLRTSEDAWDVVLAADIFYERDTAAAVTMWLQRLASRGTEVLVGDRPPSVFTPRPLRCSSHEVARGCGRQVVQRLAIQNQLRLAIANRFVQPKAMRARCSSDGPVMMTPGKRWSVPRALRASSSPADERRLADSDARRSMGYAGDRRPC